MQRQYFNFAPSTNARADANKLREAFSNLHELIEDMLSPSDERSSALAFLKTASMWAVAGVIANHPDHEAECPPQWVNDDIWIVVPTVNVGDL